MVQTKDNLAFSLFGRTRTSALTAKSCVSCGKPATKFTDKISEREYQISGLCQSCQDGVFSEDMRDEA